MTDESNCAQANQSECGRNMCNLADQQIATKCFRRISQKYKKFPTILQKKSTIQS